MLRYHLDCASVTWWVAYQNSILTIWDLFTRGQWQKTYFFSSLGWFKCCRVVVACSRKSCLRPPEVFHLGVSQYNDSPYDHSITCSADHLRRVNSNSLQYFHSLNPCKSYSSHHKYVSFSAPPLFPNPSNDSKFLCNYEFHSLSLTMLPHLKHPSISSFPIYCLSTTRGGVENLPTPGIRQVNLELTAFPHSFDNTRNTRMLYCPHPTSILLGAKQPRTKWCHSSQP